MGHAGFGAGPSISVGHSFGRVFAHHSDGRGRGTASVKGNSAGPAAAGAAMVHGKVVHLPRPEGVIVPPKHRFPRRPITDFGFSPRPRFLGFCGNSAFCGSFGAFPRCHFFRGDFDCFHQTFFFDPFFVAGFFPETLSASGPNGLLGSLGTIGVDDAQGPAPDSAAEGSLPSRNQASRGADTLLQLTDGSMYGLSGYWVEGDRIHYITDYGGENALPLARVDFAKTIELNAAQGVKFELTRKAPQREP